MQNEAGEGADEAEAGQNSAEAADGCGEDTVGRWSHDGDTESNEKEAEKRLRDEA